MVPKFHLSYSWLSLNPNLRGRRVPASFHTITPPLITGGRGRDKYIEAEGEVGSPIPVFFIGLKIKVVDETVPVEIVLRWGRKIVGSSVFAL